jgi:hypothetical protein
MTFRFTVPLLQQNYRVPVQGHTIKYGTLLWGRLFVGLLLASWAERWKEIEGTDCNATSGWSADKENKLSRLCL